MSSRSAARRSHKTPQPLRAARCLNPDKRRFYTLEKAREVAAKWNQHVYPCGNHWHLTTRSMGAPKNGH